MGSTAPGGRAGPVQPDPGRLIRHRRQRRRHAGEQYAYTIHNPLADDRDANRAYLAWYADGVRLLDVSDASRPVELASWVPPHDPFVWSVAFMGDLVLVGDVNNGVYVLRR